MAREGEEGNGWRWKKKKKKRQWVRGGGVPFGGGCQRVGREVGGGSW